MARSSSAVGMATPGPGRTCRRVRWSPFQLSDCPWERSACSSRRRSLRTRRSSHTSWLTSGLHTPGVVAKAPSLDVQLELSEGETPGGLHPGLTLG
eukprot:478975-Alexandrium_andersonii.AAC.1